MDEDSEMAESDSNLVYPKIQSIFSTINIKTEVSDYEDNQQEEVELSDYETNEYYMPIPNKIILGSKPPSRPSGELNLQTEFSKASTSEINLSFKCDECNIFFATQNDLDSHESAIHSFLVARPINHSRMSPAQSVASLHSFTEDSSQDTIIQKNTNSKLNNSFPSLKKASNKKEVKNPNTDEMEKKTDGLLCSHCNVHFPNEIELIKHTYELIPENDITYACETCNQFFTTLAELNVHRITHKQKINQKNETKLLRCYICSLYLIRPGSLKNHLLSNHNSNDISLKPVSFKGKCALCSRTFPNYRLFNKHIPYVHPKIYNSKKLVKHKESRDIVNVKKSVVRTNVYSKVRNSVKAKKQDLNLLKALSSRNTPVPNRVLFKCKKCPIHFLTCAKALEHSVQCNMNRKTATWNCNKCRRTVVISERHLHATQHSVSDKFEVITVNKGTFGKILCKCPRCQLHFHEYDFWDHIADECDTQTAKTCDICKLKFSEKFYQKHTINHSKYNYTVNDYIVVEYVDAINDVGKMEPRKKPVLYYCEICKTYMYQRKKQLIHEIGTCKMLPRKLAASGLLFPQKTTKRTKKHMSHQHQNLTLNDYMFFRLSDGAAIDPPMPDFFQCSDCAVRFSSKYDLRFHNCKTLIPKTCNKCPEKYDDIAYKLHLRFHDYYEAKANLEGESSVPKIFFSCTSCGYGFDVYDYLVRHCQNHFINSQVAPTKSCKTCNLKYPNAHEIHDSNFRILDFKHDTLLSDCWWDGFNAVSKKIKDDILANSAYGRIRNVRLDVITSGPTDRILYKCAQCNLYFNIDSVVSHTTSGCTETSRVQCESCDAVFADSNLLEQHLNIHVVYGDDIDFLKVAFNDMKDKDLNNALRESPKESLKFRKCSFCGLLIKKDDYQQHMNDHDCRQAETHVSKVGVEYKLYPEKHGTQKRIYTVYKCINCMQTIMHKNNIPRHNCNYQKGAKCGKCSLWVRSKFTKYHNELHSKLPKYLTKNIKVLEFEILDKTKAEKTKDQAYKKLENPDPDFEDNEIEGNDTRVARKNRGFNEKYIKGEDSEDSNIVRNTVGSFGDVDAQGQHIQEVVSLVNKKVVKYKLYHPKNDTHKRLYSIYKCKNCSQIIMCKINLGRHKCNWHSGTKCGKCSQWIRLYSLNKHKKLHTELPKFLTKNISVIEFEIQDQAKTSNKTLDEHEKPVLKEPPASSGSLNESVKDKKDGEVDKENETSKGPYVFRKSRVYNEDDITSDGSTAEKIVENISIFSTIEIDETLALPDTNNILDRKMYQCSRCYMCFINREVLIGHQFKCIDTVVNTLFCSLCNFTYHPCHSVLHEQLHESMKFPKIYLTHTSTKGIRVSDKLNWLYKCDTCNGYYLTWRSLQRHLDNGQHDVSEFISCDICNFRFTMKSRTRHMKVHHNNNFKWCLDSLNFEIAVSKIVYNDTSSLNTPDIEDVRDINTTDDDENTTLMSENQTPSDKIVNMERIDNNLYRCMVCCFNFIHRTTLNSHVKVNTHQLEGSTCGVCGLMFSFATVAKHTHVHHEMMKLKREDFHITTITGEVVLDDNIDNAGRAININDAIENSTNSEGAFDNSVKASGTGGDVDEMSTEVTSVDTDIVPLIRLKNKLIRRIKFDSKDEDQKITLYQCKDCKVCVRKTQTKFHVCCSDIRKKQCIQCSLVFERTVFIQHLRLHKRLQLSRKNFRLVKFGHFSNRNRVYRCVTCSTHFVGLAALEWHMDRSKHDCTTVRCDVCQLNFGKSSISRHLIVHHTRSSESEKQFDIFSVRCINNDLSKSEEEAFKTNNSSNVSESILALESTIKLFKCVECDVFFLTQCSYYQHIYNHAALDPTEFIECKMCRLQFLTESLADHMKTHKNKTFNLEQVLIESFEPTTGQSVTKAYEAEDIVSSKHIVSTTTPFDEVGAAKIEEQQSTIDSTSDVNT